MRTWSQAKREAKAAPGTLANLPNETLDLIFSKFSTPQSTAPDAYFRGTEQLIAERSWHSLQCGTLFSLCLVSRHFRNVVQPILYREFVPGYGDSWISELYTWDGRLVSFLRAITERPDLAALVKRVYIHSLLVKCISQDGIKQAARELGIKKWEQMQNIDLVSILITKLPNLSHFSFQTGVDPQLCLNSSYLRPLRPSFLPLTTIDINTGAVTDLIDYYRLFNLESSAGPVLKLCKNLETLNLHMCGGIQSQAPIPALPNLKNLCITHSNLTEKDLEGLLSSCSSLRTFVYEVTEPHIYTAPQSCGYEHHDPFVPGDHFSPGGHSYSSNAIGYLYRHRAALKSLHLDLRKRFGAMSEISSAPSFRLKDFTALEHLFFNTGEICYNGETQSVAESQTLVWFLPASIASIDLEGHPGNLFPRFTQGLLGLAKAVSQGEFPRLKQIRCDVGHLIEDYAVCSMFAEVGVDFKEVRFPSSNATVPSNFRAAQRPHYSPEPMPLPEYSDEDL
ncbi:hypothetical protein V492_07344 [Pseudogymnoascus sp. VKM F-4246]|nr:hypothetical protein V492_07344 [Pseudogymnoascus sp. VKM F-4246]